MKRHVAYSDYQLQEAIARQLKELAEAGGYGAHSLGS